MTHFLFTPLTIALLNPLTPTAPPTSAPGPAAVWPLTPRPAIVRGFEPPPKPWLSGHRGIDLSGSPGQQVRSATPGTVTYAATLAGRGVIVITNGQLRTTYEPVIATVRVGTPVTPGTPLGHLSAAGSHCVPATCLHWGLLQATTYRNPLSLLPHHPIRLLPLSPHTTPAPPHRPPAAPTRGSAIPRHPELTAPPWLPAHPPDDPTGHQPTRPSAPPDPATPPTSLEVEASPRGELASGVLVSLAAAATLIGSLLIRRH